MRSTMHSRSAPKSRSIKSGSRKKERARERQRESKNFCNGSKVAIGKGVKEKIAEKSACEERWGWKGKSRTYEDKNIWSSHSRALCWKTREVSFSLLWRAPFPPSISISIYLNFFHFHALSFFLSLFKTIALSLFCLLAFPQWESAVTRGKIKQRLKEIYEGLFEVYACTCIHARLCKCISQKCEVLRSACTTLHGIEGDVHDAAESVASTLKNVDKLDTPADVIPNV